MIDFKDFKCSIIYIAGIATPSYNLVQNHDLCDSRMHIVALILQQQNHDPQILEMQRTAQHSSAGACERRCGYAEASAMRMRGARVASVVM